MSLVRVVITVLIVGGIVRAQSQAGAATGPEFEVASVKQLPGGSPGGPPSGGPGTQDMGQFNWPGVSLRNLIASAYDVSTDQVTVPDWIGSQMYSVAAKIPAGATGAQFSTMLQNLLAERFRMTIHRESRIVDGYDLVVAKGGPKLKESVEANGGGRSSFGPEGATRTFNKITMRAFANMLGMRASDFSDGVPMGPGGPAWVRIADKTGLTGVYDISLHYALPGRDNPGPDIFGALESQLGLSLKPTKISLDMVVVDRAEKTPTEN